MRSVNPTSPRAATTELPTRGASAVSPRTDPAKKLLSGTVNFGQKQHDKYFFFVPGEELSGFASLKLASPAKFAAIRLCVEGTLQVKNGYNPNPKPKEEASNAKTFVTRRTCSYFSYQAKQGDDKVRTMTFPFKITVPVDAGPSFEWTGPSKPDSQVSASLHYRLICWLDPDGVEESHVPAISDARTAGFVELTVISAEVANAFGGPKTAAALPNRETRARAADKGLELELDCTQPVVPVPVSGLTGHLSFVVEVRNTSKKNPVDGLVLWVEELITIRIPDPKKPLTISTGIVRDKSNQFFVPALKSDRHKHNIEITTPRGNDNIGCVRNPTVSTDIFSIDHSLSALPVMKGVKEGAVRATLPLVFGPQPSEAHKVFEFTFKDE